MKNQELLEYIGLFREKAEQGKLVVFVGAGVLSAFIMPSACRPTF